MLKKLLEKLLCMHVTMTEYINYTFNPKSQTASDVINMEQHKGLKYIETKYINEYEAVVVFETLATKFN